MSPRPGLAFGPLGPLVALMIFAALPVLAGCKGEGEAPAAAEADAPDLLRLEGETMGTTWRVQVDPALGAEATKGEIEAVLEAVNALASTYRGDSEVSRLNAAQTTEPIPLSPALRQLLAQALTLSAKSGGAFDPTAGPLMSLYGFRGAAAPPTETTRAAALERVGWQKLTLEGDAARKAHPLLQVDLGGIAKGYGVDLVLAHLKAQGAQHILVEIGGEVAVTGGHPDGSPWQIAIERPMTGSGSHGEAPITLPLREGALATSGDYLQRVQLGGEERHHIFDPRTGENAPGDLSAVTVFAPTALLADGLATAVMVLGQEEGARLVASQGGALLTQTKDPEGGLKVWRSEGFPETGGM